MKKMNIEEIKEVFYGKIPLDLYEVVMFAAQKMYGDSTVDTDSESVPKVTKAARFRCTELKFDEVLGHLNCKKWESVSEYMSNKNGFSSSTVKRCLSEGVRRGLVDRMQKRYGDLSRECSVYRLSSKGFQKYLQQNTSAEQAVLDISVEDFTNSEAKA